MPAIGTRAALARTRAIRLLGLAVALLFMASVGTAQATPVAAKDWTPQIQTTRRAQIYWEGIMRSADAELRALKKARKQTQFKLKAVKAKRTRAIARRAAAKQKLKDARTRTAEARRQLRAAESESPALLPATLAPQIPLLPTPLPFFASELIVEEQAETDLEVVAVEPPTTATGGALDEETVQKLERKLKKAKRSFRIAKRKAKRSSRSTRALKHRLTSIKSATRSATARRESAERSLGAWILAMTKYGRIRASKKSVRPGVNSSFAWPVRGSISQYFHRGHDGLDIVRYSGAPVRSMAYGVVTYVGWNPWDQHRRAFMVVVTHASGYETLYGHLRPTRIVRVGAEVKKGQVIGYMGNTGNSSGPHLHLELRRGRTTINPLGVL